jgi:hypothetical protein
MTRGMRNGLILAAVHLAIVGSLGVKLLADRATRPRVWVRAAPVDPNLPIRGRYLSLRLVVDHYERMPSPTVLPGMAPGQVTTIWGEPKMVRFEARDGRLSATGSDVDTGVTGHIARRASGEVVVLDPVAFFIPESVRDPSIRRAGEELWAEVTLPRRGPPRPIRLGVKKDGTLTPLIPK